MTPTPDSQAPDFLTMSLGELADAMGITLVEASVERVVATMPVEGNRQPYGLLNGGANAVLAETIGSIAGAIHAGPDKAVVGLDINCTHHRAVRSGTVTGVATPITLGRTIASYDIRMTDDAGKPVATARLTVMIRPVSPS